MHERLRGRAQLLVAVEPLRVVGREHVRLDPERGQMGRQLERPLNAATAGRRPVHRHQENFHWIADAMNSRARMRDLARLGRPETGDFMTSPIKAVENVP